MTIPITAHASSHNVTHHVNAMANHRSTKANDKANGRIPETSLHWCNNHQGTQRKVKKVMAQDKALSSQADANQEEAKARHLANISRHRVHSRETALYIAKQATICLIVLSVADFRLC